MPSRGRRYRAARLYAASFDIAEVRHSEIRFQKELNHGIIFGITGKVLFSARHGRGWR